MKVPTLTLALKNRKLPLSQALIPKALEHLMAKGEDFSPSLPGPDTTVVIRILEETSVLNLFETLSQTPGLLVALESALSVLKTEVRDAAVHIPVIEHHLPTPTLASKAGVAITQRTTQHRHSRALAVPSEPNPVRVLIVTAAGLCGLDAIESVHGDAEVFAGLVHPLRQHPFRLQWGTPSSPPASAGAHFLA